MQKILLIESNPTIRDAITDVLSLDNYTVITASDGKEGFALAVKEHPDLVICDVLMPLLDGFGVLKLLKYDRTLAGIPFIFLTAKTDRSEIRKCMDMGADDFLFKPIDPTELLQAVKSVLDKHAKVIQSIHIPTAANASEITLLDLASRKYQARALQKNQHLFQQGDLPRFLFFITKGMVKKYMCNEVGKQLLRPILNPESL